MKKIISATLLLVALSTASFASGKDDQKLFSDLQAALKSSTAVQWSLTSDYNKATYSFNGKSVSAFYNLDDNSLMGFSIHVVGNNFPQDIANAIQKKYGGWKIVDAIYFIDEHANGNYFAQIRKGKSNFAVKVLANGRISIFTKMPSQ